MTGTERKWIRANGSTENDFLRSDWSPGAQPAVAEPEHTHHTQRTLCILVCITHFLNRDRELNCFIYTGTRFPNCLHKSQVVIFQTYTHVCPLNCLRRRQRTTNVCRDCIQMNIFKFILTIARNMLRQIWVTYLNIDKRWGSLYTIIFV